MTGSELNRQQVGGHPLPGKLDQVPGPQLGQHPLVAAGPVNDALKFFPGQEDALADEVRNQDLVSIEPVEAQREQLPATWLDCDRLPF